MHKIHVVCLRQHNNEFGDIALTQVACSYIRVTIAGCNTATSFGSSSPLFLGYLGPQSFVPRVPSPLFLRSPVLCSSGPQSFVPRVPSLLFLRSPVLRSLGPQSFGPWSPVLRSLGPQSFGPQSFVPWVPSP